MIQSGFVKQTNTNKLINARKTMKEFFSAHSSVKRYSNSSFLEFREAHERSFGIYYELAQASRKIIVK
mgnify:CR=1 FL=1